MRKVLALVVTLMSLAAGALLPGRARADCAFPTWPQAVDRASVVLYGSVTDVDVRLRETFYTVTPEAVYKGQPANPVIVRSPSGRTVWVEDDYPMQSGTSHTLYLRAGQDGYYETGMCSRSHSGKPGAEEIALLGQGSAPPPLSPTSAQQSWHQWVVIIAMGVALAAVGITVLSTRRRRER
jgi:hypothetical protein